MEIVDKLKALQFRTSRSLLFTWVKPTVLGTSELDLEDAVCYVLPFRSTADLLVTDKVCEQHGLPRPVEPIEHIGERRAVFFVGHPEGRLGRRTRRQQSERMVRLFAERKNAVHDIKIVPVSIFWGHQPDREKSIFKLVLSENWTVTNSFKKLLSIIFHPNHILVQFSAPVSLTQLTSNEANREKQIRKLLRVLRVHFNHQRHAVIGPDLSHRRTLINTMLGSRAVRNAIAETAEKTGTPTHKIDKIALADAREIASHQSYRVIRFFHVILTWLWQKLYDGVDVHNIEQLRQLASSHEIIYTPCHRSHIDYLLLSYVLYHNGLAPPHIAAGKNLNLPILGGLLRRAGAFFMRRSFKGDPLYQAVFDEYLHLMFIKGYSVEYFIEGGRSRTGRTLTPRTGMLSMTIGSFQRDSHRPICLMPVYFGYERVLEVATYMGELSGQSKKAESLLDIFGVIRSFRYSFGKVTVNFGEPVLLDTFLDEHLPDWQTPENADPGQFSEACHELAGTLATNINNAVAINPIALVATALLCTDRQTMEESQLLQQIEILRSIADGVQYSDRVIVSDLPGREVLDTAIKVTGISREEHSFGATVSATTELAAMLTYYRNNVINVFAIPSLIARYIRSHSATSQSDVVTFTRTLYAYLQSEFLLPWQCDDVEAVCSRSLVLLSGLDLIVMGDDGITTPEPTSAAYAALTDLAEIIEPTLERFYIVVALLEATQDQSLEALESDASFIAEKLSIIFGINSPTFFERSLFSNFIKTLNANGMIHLNEAGFRVTEGFSYLAENTADTLDADIRYHVLQALNTRQLPNVAG